MKMQTKNLAAVLSWPKVLGSGSNESDLLWMWTWDKGQLSKRKRSFAITGRANNRSSEKGCLMQTPSDRCQYRPPRLNRNANPVQAQSRSGSQETRPPPALPLVNCLVFSGFHSSSSMKQSPFLQGCWISVTSIYKVPEQPREGKASTGWAG